MSRSELLKLLQNIDKRKGFYNFALKRIILNFGQDSCGQLVSLVQIAGIDFLFKQRLKVIIDHVGRNHAKAVVMIPIQKVRQCCRTISGQEGKQCALVLRNTLRKAWEYKNRYWMERITSSDHCPQLHSTHFRKK